MHAPIYVHGLSWWLSGKESTCQFKRYCFHPWVGKIPWRRKWQPTLWYFCLGNPMNRGAWHVAVLEVTRVRHGLATEQQQFMCMLLLFSHQACPTLYDSMDCSMPSFPVSISYSLPKFMTIESLMPSNHLILCYCLLLLPSIFPSISLFQWIVSLDQLTEILELQHQSFQWIFRVDFLYNWLVGSPCSTRDSQQPSPAP